MTEFKPIIRDRWHGDVNVLILTPDEVQQLYDQIKSRLKSEAVLNVWPDEPLDCQGITGNIGKIK